MRALVIGLAIALIGGAAMARDVWVEGYYKADGTYVQGHYRSDPNSTTSDNYSTRGNQNPYTGQPGTKADTRPYGQTQPAYGSSYGQQPANSSYGQKKKNCTVYSPC